MSKKKRLLLKKLTTLYFLSPLLLPIFCFQDVFIMRLISIGAWETKSPCWSGSLEKQIQKKHASDCTWDSSGSRNRVRSRRSLRPLQHRDGRADSDALVLQTTRSGAFRVADWEAHCRDTRGHRCEAAESALEADRTGDSRTVAVTRDAREREALFLSLFILTRVHDYWLEPLTGRLALPPPFAGPLVNHPQIS